MDVVWKDTQEIAIDRIDRVAAAQVISFETIEASIEGTPSSVVRWGLANLSDEWNIEESLGKE